MSEVDLIDEFLDALSRDPQAAPPLGLDPKTAEFLRALVASENESSPSRRLQARVWYKVLAQADSKPTPFDNGKSTDERLSIRQTHKHIHIGDEHMTTISTLRPTPRTERGYGRHILTLGAAVLLLVLLGGLLLTMLDNNPPILPIAGLSAQSDPLEANKALVRRYYEEVWGRQNLDLIGELVSADYKIHLNELSVGELESLEWFIPALYAAIPDAQVQVREILAEGNVVAARVIFSGTHTGSFGDVQPTGKSVLLSLTTIVHIADGKIAKEWLTMDYLGLMVQLEAIPEEVIEQIFGISDSTASALLKDANGQVVGVAFLSQTDHDEVELRVNVEGMTPGLHGIHIHAVGTCDTGGDTPFSSAGGHFNPLAKEHGLENPSGAHGGDLPNLEVNTDGGAYYRATTDRIIILPGSNSVFDEDGSAIVIHAAPDDQTTDPSGNSGERIVCGVIEQ